MLEWLKDTLVLFLMAFISSIAILGLASLVWIFSGNPAAMLHAIGFLVLLFIACGLLAATDRIL